MYTRDEIPSWFHYSDNARILPLFLLADDGYDVAIDKESTWDPPGYPVWGNHGYDNRLPSMRPLFMAQGPRFKSAYKHPNIFENVDLYPLMLNILEIPEFAFPSNGTFSKVKSMLKDH